MRLYHTSDLHDHRGIAAPLCELRRRAPGLLFDSGDSLRGSQTVYFRREPIIAELAAAGYDAQAMGNREFHYLFGLVCARAAKMRHALLCANLIDLRGRMLPFAPERTFTLFDPRTSTPRPLRVFALLVPQYPAGSPWERLFGWRFLDPHDVAARFAATSPAGTLLVLLSHLGLPADRRLAAAVPRLDLILGGHSHDTLRAPAYVGAVPIVHAGPYGEWISQVDLTYDAGAGRARIDRYQLLPLLRRDPAAA